MVADKKAPGGASDCSEGSPVLRIGGALVRRVFSETAGTARADSSQASALAVRLLHEPSARRACRPSEPVTAWGPAPRPSAAPELAPARARSFELELASVPA